MARIASRGHFGTGTDDLNAVHAPGADWGAASDDHRTIDETRIVDMLLLGGWAFERAGDDDTAGRAEVLAAIDRWVAAGMGCRSVAGRRLFDPVEVVNFMTWAGVSGSDDFWNTHYVTTGRRLVGSSAPDGATQRRFAVDLQRRFDLRGFDAGAALRLRMPVPLAGPSVTDIDLSTACSVDGAEVRLADGRLEVRLKAPDDRHVDIAATGHFTARRELPSPGDLTDTERALYLRPVEGLIRISPRIAALAVDLAGRRSDPLEAIRRYWDYIMDALFCGMIHYDQVPPEQGCDWVLDHRWFDCQIGSALLVALCRAHGIPARIVGGHVLYPLAPTNHFWAEAWIDGRGWTPFDLLSWTLSAGGRDPAWRDHFFAHLDFRMFTQLLPLSFTGPMSVRFPDRWHMLQRSAGTGVSVTFEALDGSPVFEDRVAIYAASG